MHSAAASLTCCFRADTARKLGRLTGLLIEAGRPGEAVPLLRRALAAAEDEQQVPAQVACTCALRVGSWSTGDQ